MQIYNSIVTCVGSMSSCACHLYIQPCIWFTRWVLSLLVEMDRKQLCVQFLLFFFYDPCAALQTLLRPDRQIKCTACALHLRLSLFNFLRATSIMFTSRFYILDSQQQIYIGIYSMIAAALGFNTLICAALLEDVLAPYKSPPNPRAQRYICSTKLIRYISQSLVNHLPSSLHKVSTYLTILAICILIHLNDFGSIQSRSCNRNGNQK